MTLCLPKYRSDLIIKAFSAVSHIEYLQGFFYGNAPLECLVIHEELDYVEQLARLQASFVRDASFIHGLEFLFADKTIEVIVHFLKKKQSIKVQFQLKHALTHMISLTSDLEGF